MNVLVTVQVALAWVVGLGLLHRLNVQRLRGQARLVALRRLDWDALLSGLLPGGATDDPDFEGSGPHSPHHEMERVPATFPDGAPMPALLRRRFSGDTRARHAVLLKVASGLSLGEAEETRKVFSTAGFSEGAIRWLSVLAELPRRPLAALELLEASPPDSAAELYLREYLSLLHRTNVFNLELQVLGARHRLQLGLSRFGNVPALHFARALAAPLVGWNQAATNDLARAVYFSRTSVFYLRAVLDTPWLFEARPELVHQCRIAWEEKQRVDSLSK